MKLNMSTQLYWSTIYLTVQSTLPDSVQQLHVQQSSTYTKTEAASAVLGS